MFVFSNEEIKDKKNRVRKLLDELELDAVYFKKTANFSWITAGGYSIVGFASEIGIAGILITKDREYLICNNIESARMENEERMKEQGYEIVSYPWYDDKEASIVQSLGGKRLGADHALAGCKDISNSIAPLRYSLGSWEIPRYTKQAQDTARIVEETAMTIRPGDTEQAIIGRLSEKLWSHGMDYIVAVCASDERISLYRHAVATDKKISKRAMISVNSRCRGLIVSITRFVQFGRLSTELRQLYLDNVYVDCAMMAATVPGRPASEVFNAAVKAYAEKGYPEEYKLHHQGGPIGYVGREYKPSANTKETIRENQAFTWNPSITGMKSEDTMLATKNGPIVLTVPVIYPAISIEKDGYTFNRPDILEL